MGRLGPIYYLCHNNVFCLPFSMTINFEVLIFLVCSVVSGITKQLITVY